MARISILVAVYNAEKFLNQCLDSLLSQTLQDIEIICVDDASTDSSFSILEDYQSRDRRISVMRLEQNSGQAVARNRALETAEGEYICFVDSDDWLAPDALYNIVETFDSSPDTDSVLFNVVYYYGEHRPKVYAMPDFESKTGEEAFVDSLTWKIHGVYAVRKEIHKRFPYDDSSRAYSDDNTTRLHYLNSRKVRKSTATYYYRQHSDSVTHAISPKRFDYLRANWSMKKQLEVLNVSDEILDIYEEVRWLNIVGLYMFYYLHRNHLPPESSEEGLALIKKMWQSIETDRLPRRLMRKFGYMPFRGCWLLFRLQEELYFFLRGLLKKNIE